jgi:membrane associated rhomboid family serine protease
MIPLRDSAGAPRLSPVNLTLIAVNVAVYGYEAWMGPAADHLITRYGMIPVRIASLGSITPLAWGQPILTLLTALFLHGGVLHLAGNMLYLFIFGPAVEARFGRKQYFLFYLAAGVAGNLAMVFIDLSARTPVIGASGAIAAVLGAYFVLYPRERILTILPIFLWIEFIEVPVVLYLLLWFGLQLYSAMQNRAFQSLAGGVAWWAHIGGFMFGLAAAPILARREAPPRRRSPVRKAAR